MALIIEDGSGLSDANTFVSLEDFRLFAQLRNAGIPEGDPECEALLIKAADFLTFNFRFKGYPSQTDQRLSFPRSGILIDGEDFPDNVIPVQLKEAQMFLSIAGMSYDFAAPVVFPVYKRVRVEGAVDVSYPMPSDIGTADTTTVFPFVERLLEDFLVAPPQHNKVIRV